VTRLQNKTSLVTGAASGIGLAIARRFAQEGAQLVLVDVASEKLRSQVEVLQEEEDCLIEFLAPADVSEEDTLEEAVAIAESQFGQLDVLVNNACAADHQSITDLDREDWEQTLGNCLTSVFFGIKHALPVMKRQGSGSIINISSVNSRVGSPGMPAYTAAKGGVVGLTRQVAVEYGPDGIRANAIRPGFTVTEEMREGLLSDPAERRTAIESCPLRRLGTPEDIANVALFLATDEAAYVNGHVLTADGGASIQWAPTLVRPGLRKKAGLDPL